MDPVTASALIGAGGSGLSSIVGNVASVRAQKLANKANLQIAQMNNEWNAQQAALSRNWQEQMMDKQNQWNLDQWNRENQYNSASAQRQRYEEAGLNSALMMQGNGAGTAGSITSAGAGQSPTPTAQQVTMQPARFDFSGIAQAINSYYTNKSLAEDVVSKQRNNAVGAEALRQFPQEYVNAYLAGMSGRDVTDLSPVRINAMNRVAPLTVYTGAMRGLVELDNARTEGQLKMAQVIGQNLDNESKGIMNKYLDSQQQAELIVKLADIAEMMSRKKLTDAQAKTEFWKAISEMLGAKGAGLDYKMKSALLDNVIATTLQELAHNEEYYGLRRQRLHDIVSGEGSTAALNAQRSNAELHYLKTTGASPSSSGVFPSPWFLGRFMQGLLRPFGGITPFFRIGK